MDSYGKRLDAASPVASSQVLISLIAFILVYSFLGAVGFYLIAKNAKKGPEAVPEAVAEPAAA